jgi:sugar lactone lactonase YvrE
MTQWRTSGFEVHMVPFPSRLRRAPTLLRGIVVAATIVGTGLVVTSLPAQAATPALTIFAGTPGTRGTPTDGQQANQTPFQAPGSVAVAANGDVYIGDIDDGLYKVSGGTVATIDPLICEPYGVAPAASGNVLVASDCTSGLTSVSPDGTETIVPGTTGIDDPTGVAIDGSGNIYVSSGFGVPYDVYKITPDGTVSVFATSADVGHPFALATDSAGNVYVADTQNNQVHKITPAGVVTTLPTPVLNDPQGVAVDSAGDVFISDNGDFKVIEVTPAGTSSTVAGTGVQGQPADGPPTSVNLAGPAGLAVDSAGDLLVADYDFNNQGVVEEVSNVSPPSAPIPGAPSYSDGSIIFPWAAVPGAVSYTVTVYVNGVAQAPVTGLTGPSYTIGNPTAGATYSFSVAAVNGVGTGGTSPISSSIAVPGSSSGYWTVGGDGGVFSFGPGFYGSTGNLKLNQPVLAISSTADGKGYWFVARDGGVFAYGDALFNGSVPALGVKVTNIVGMAADTATGGYWLVGSDGGVYAFDAPFVGSVPGLGQHVTDVVGIAPTTDGGGYYVATSTGAIYAFGDAKYQGGANATAHLNAPVVGISVDSATGGYWLASSDGGVYAFGAPFEGSAGGTKLDGPVVGISATTDGSGYYLVAADGGVSSYNAPFLGSMGGKRLNAPMVGMALAG